MANNHGLSQDLIMSIMQKVTSTLNHMYNDDSYAARNPDVVVDMVGIAADLYKSQMKAQSQAPKNPPPTNPPPANPVVQK